MERERKKNLIDLCKYLKERERKWSIDRDERREDQRESSLKKWAKWIKWWSVAKCATLRWIRQATLSSPSDRRSSVTTSSRKSVDLSKRSCCILYLSPCSPNLTRLSPSTLRMSSMDKETMKFLLKILQSGLKTISTEAKEKLKKNGSAILDKDRQKELEGLLDKLEMGDDSSDNFLVRYTPTISSITATFYAFSYSKSSSISCSLLSKRLTYSASRRNCLRA